MARDGNTLYLLPNSREFVIQVPFSPGKTREGTFGKITASKRIDIKPQFQQEGWRGVHVLEHFVLFFDGKSLGVLEAKKEKMVPIIRRSIAQDLIKPPADRGGEAPEFETIALRKKFNKNFRLATTMPFSGWTYWRQTKTRQQYLVSSRVPGFPLMQLDCDLSEGSSCLLARQCWLPLPKGVDAQGISGLTYVKKNKLLMIGDAKKHRLLKFKVNSCGSIRYLGELPLPAKVNLLTNLFVDEDENLWVTTFKPDNYHNASLYFWPKADWNL